MVFSLARSHIIVGVLSNVYPAFSNASKVGTSPTWFGRPYHEWCVAFPLLRIWICAFLQKLLNHLLQALVAGLVKRSVAWGIKDGHMISPPTIFSHSGNLLVSVASWKGGRPIHFSNFHYLHICIYYIYIYICHSYLIFKLLALYR